MEQEHGRMPPLGGTAETTQKQSKDGVAGEMKRLSVKNETHAELQKLRIKLSVNSFDAVICLLIQFYQTHSEGASSQQNATQEASFPENPSQALLDDTGSSHVHSKKIADNPTPEIKLIKKEIEEPQASDDPGAYQTYIATEIQEFEGEWAGDDDVRDDRIEPQSRENLKTRPNEQRLEVAHTEDSSAKRKKVLSLDGEHSGAGLGSLSDDEDGWTEDDDGDKNVIDMKCEIASTQDEDDQHTASQHVWNSEEPTDGYRIGDSSSAAEAGTMSEYSLDRQPNQDGSIAGNLVIKMEVVDSDSNSVTFSNHREIDSEEKKVDAKPHHCSVCRKGFSQKKCLNEHMRSHSGEKKICCPFCPKVFSRNCDFSRHRKDHPVGKPYQCRVCKKQFSSGSHLSAHKLIHERDNPGANAEACEGSVPENRDLSKQDENNSGKSINVCAVCKKMCFSKDELSVHMRIHNEIEKTSYHCALCNKNFSSEAQHSVHMRIHREIEQKTHKCDHCDKIFSTKDELSIHMTIHKFQCQVCNLYFRQKSDYERHGRIHAGVKPFQCSVCSRRFVRNYHLTEHMRIHTGERPFKCSVCNKSFTRNSHLTEHMRIHSI